MFDDDQFTDPFVMFINNIRLSKSRLRSSVHSTGSCKIATNYLRNTHFWRIAYNYNVFPYVFLAYDSAYLYNCYDCQLCLKFVQGKGLTLKTLDKWVKTTRRKQRKKETYIQINNTSTSVTSCSSEKN